MTKQSSRPRRRLGWLIAAVLALALVLGCAAYVADYYHASEQAVTAMAGGQSYTVEPLDGGLVFAPAHPSVGLIFYPGGKVEHTAYAPLMARLAENGVYCVLLKMPLRLAVTDKNAAARLLPSLPDLRWYVGGHSLGGAMAAACAADHPEGLEGVLLLGAYSTADLSQSGLRVLSVYGSEDGVLDREKYAACRDNLPGDFAELVIDGGCHAFFGDYGPQKGDGTPTVTRETQLAETAAFFTDAVFGADALRLELASEALLADPAGYDGFDADTSEWQMKLCLRNDGPMRDLRVLALLLEDVDADGTPAYRTETLYRQDRLPAGRPFVLGMTFWGDLPTYGVAYRDAGGAEHAYAIGDSGYDGSLLLIDMRIID